MFVTVKIRSNKEITKWSDVGVKKIGDSRSNRSRDIRVAHFVMDNNNERTGVRTLVRQSALRRFAKKGPRIFISVVFFKRYCIYTLKLIARYKRPLKWGKIGLV